MAIKITKKEARQYVQMLQYKQFLREHRPVDPEWVKRIASPLKLGKFAFFTPMLGICMYATAHRAYYHAIDCAVIEGVDIVVFSGAGRPAFTITVAEAVRMSLKGHGTAVARKYFARQKYEKKTPSK